MLYYIGPISRLKKHLRKDLGGSSIDGLTARTPRRDKTGAGRGGAGQAGWVGLGMADTNCERCL